MLLQAFDLYNARLPGEKSGLSSPDLMVPGLPNKPTAYCYAHLRL
ncbi:MAG: hypothetical protein RL539_1100 [Pseudomonadota bacterium]|jgi:hypothetical protein